MRSRATSTEELPSWKTWIVKDYAKYWYVLALLAILVLGVGELARQWRPLTAGGVGGLFAVTLTILGLGTVGYILLWRRQTPPGQWLLALPQSFGAGLRRLAGVLGLGGGASDPPQDDDPDAHHREDDGEDRETDGSVE